MCLCDDVEHTYTHTHCRLVSQAYSTANKNAMIANLNFQIGQTYYIEMDQENHGGNGLEDPNDYSMNSAFCVDGTWMKFVYAGSPLICKFEVTTKLHIDTTQSGCVQCPHYKQHALTASKTLSSTDACYARNFTAQYYKSLRTFWQEYKTGTLSEEIKQFIKEIKADDVKTCLYSYIGIIMPDSSGFCTDTLGNMCLNEYCVSAVSLSGGLTNKPPDQQEDTMSLLQCRLNKNTWNNGDLSKLTLCDSCVIEFATVSGKTLHIPQFSNSVKKYCSKIILALASDVPMNVNTSALILSQLSNENNGWIKGIEIPIVRDADIMIKLLVHHLAIYNLFDLSVRYDLDTLNIEYFVKGLTKNDIMALKGIKYITLKQGVSQTVKEHGAILLSAFLFHRAPLSIYYALPYKNQNQIIQDLTDLQKIRHVQVAVYNILSELSKPDIYMIYVRAAATGYDPVDKHGVVDMRVTKGTRYYYYIMNIPEYIYCPYINSYSNGILLLKFPYESTSLVESLDMYITTDTQFTCTLATATPQQTCAVSNPKPTKGLSLLSFTEELIVPGVPYFLQNKTCVYYEQKLGALCSASTVPKTINTQLYLVNGRMTGEVTDMGSYYITTYKYAKVIGERVNIVEMIALEQVCSNINISEIQTCKDAVCGSNTSCDATVVCAMEENVRSSLDRLVKEFEYAKTRYKDTISVAETWTQSKSIRPKRFIVGALVAGAAMTMATVSIAMSGVALYQAGVAMADAAIAKANAERNRLQLIQLANNVEIIKNSVSKLNNRVDALESSVTTISNRLVVLSNIFDKKLSETNLRISQLEAYVVRQFNTVRTFITKVATELTNNLEKNQRADLYYQQLLAFSNVIIQNTARLISQTDMYSTCLQSIQSNNLYGCPISNPFINSNPDYKIVKSVSGAVYDSGVLAVLYSVPLHVQLVALYKVFVKPVTLNGLLQVVDTSDVVMGPDGMFYHTPYCEERYCNPLVQNVKFTKCFGFLQSAYLEGIAQYCLMIPCNKKDCADKLHIETMTGTLALPGERLNNIKLDSKAYVQFNNYELSLDNLPQFAHNASLDIELKKVIMSIQSDVMIKLNKSQELGKEVNDLLAKVDTQKIIDALNDPLYGISSGGLSGTTIAIIVLVILLLIIILGMVLYCYCQTKQRTFNNDQYNGYAYKRM